MPEAQVERLDSILRSVSAASQHAMRLAMSTLWTRFVYARSLLDADEFLPHHGTRVLPRDGVFQHKAMQALRSMTEGGAPDAFETIMLALALRRTSGHADPS